MLMLMKMVPTVTIITMVTDKENLDLLRQVFIGLDFALLPGIPLKRCVTADCPSGNLTVWDMVPDPWRSRLLGRLARKQASAQGVLSVGNGCTDLPGGMREGASRTQEHEAEPRACAQASLVRVWRWEPTQRLLRRRGHTTWTRA